MVRSVFYASAVALLAVAIQGKEAEPNAELAASYYDSGVAHNTLMQMKMDSWKRAEEAGVMVSSRYPELGYTKCVNGFAEAIPGDRNNTFRCNNIDLYHFLSHAALGDDVGEGSSSWGWTSDDGREFVAIGQFNGTAFVEIGEDGRMSYLGRLPKYGDALGSFWREIRTYKSYIVIGSEAVDHGIQIFDLRKLLTIDPKSPVTFTMADMTAWTRAQLPRGSAHNVAINEELGYFTAVGAQPRTDPFCRSGLVFYDLKDPSNPVPLGCAAGDGYVHDTQCLVYRGPDKRYQGRDICYGYNEDTLTIYDVTNKANVTTIISRTSYEGASFTHQGWVLDVNNQEFLVMDDELDEVNARGQAAAGYSVTYIWDIRDLEAPKQTGSYKSKVKAVDHNQYVIDGFNYQSNYCAGLRVYDVRSIPEDPSGAGVCEVAWLDIYPEDDFLPGGGGLEFFGTWSNYAFFKSGYIFINTIERGAFVAKLTGKSCPKPPVCNADNCLRAFRANTIPGRLEESQKFCSTFTNYPITAPTSLPKYAVDGCKGDSVARASSACSCLPTATPAP
ncbi:hypothetical protein BDZ85DRAFT_215457 [Elsinoe ampelina]|uniref:Uncharacterized protein n=1 Tax=Elsinoe ampelina TaxID=302913 RepID=A0A6A6GHZ0_9PEZI|nr:hypothetical protein BDZ85DRAFT_215457 [Elsinoe ampelina]